MQFENVKLTHREEEVMQILWKLRKAFVNDLIEALPEPKPPYNTVSSIVRKLESEGLVGYEAFGKTYRYYPILTKEAYLKHSFGNFIDSFFEGKPENVLSYFVKEEGLSTDELNSLLEKIKKNS